ncbi:MAG: serine/threonine protein kinase [Planctomycetaceae bacterium]|nr:serine/threonine protein kinase [Planctomycetaceae bacterium]
MDNDRTEIQDERGRRQAAERSLAGSRPPTVVPGYEAERFLGAGAYGEVWVAVERNTGRRVAVKFYAHRGGLDWSLLSREVEKLAFLFADRYVVQLLGVGWDAEPPYYVMEYLENGSLAERIAGGPLSVAAAVAMFRDVAVGLVHAHGKGVLHCDLKPSNILLDQDGKPRLADFGQSRLSSEQEPALGTMFYMAPEQADLSAVPDVRWDVYALGALLYRMLTGAAPYAVDPAAERLQQTADLNERLAQYRQMIEQSPPPLGHRRMPGVDKPLAAIVDRCLAKNPSERFPNVQAVLNALDERAARQSRRPLLIFGAIGPALLLAVVAWFAWNGFSAAIGQSDEALTRRALEANQFAAQFVGQVAADELESRFQAVEQVAASEPFRRALAAAAADPEFQRLIALLNDAKRNQADLEPYRDAFRENAARRALEKAFLASIPTAFRWNQDGEVASWFFCDANGISTVRAPKGRTLGMNFAWRSYFHGAPRDYREDWRPKLDQRLPRTSISDVFRSKATSHWAVAISTPVVDESEPGIKKFLGVVAMTVEVGRFVQFPGTRDQFAVLVDQRDGDHKGVILQHPRFDELPKLADRLKNYRLTDDQLPDVRRRQRDYHDPMSQLAPRGGDARQWLARMEPVRVRGRETGWIVLVQQSYDAAIGEPLGQLKKSLVRDGLIALTLVALVMAGLWGIARGKRG